jgi:hypothetical protein
MNTNGTQVKNLALDNGFFYVVEFSATGGVRYTRKDGHEEQEGERLMAEFTTQKDVDHVGMLKWSKKIVNMAYNTMERHASSTPIGYWVRRDAVEALHKEIAEVQHEADRFNLGAQAVGCGRRVRIALYAVQATESEHSVAARLAETVRERLTELGEHLRAGELNSYAATWKKAKNLPRLATGIQAEAIVFALEAAVIARAEVAAGIREGKTPEQAGAAVDLTALESAVCLFTDAVNGSLYQAHDPVLDA